ncbi:MAG: 3-dehydroquinate synthase family protein [Elusimicrobiota bacterium]|nr:3-dehydroquinate synthase family protein [Elusimicrobiota bacterium]
MPLENFTVKSKLKDYEVFFGEAAEYLPRLAAGPDCVFAIDENVWRLHKDSALKSLESAPKVILPIGEAVKTLESVQLLYDRIVGFSPKKNMRLVSIGGGITQDITGFAASTLYRGVKWTFIPTTLLAQADSCIGGKTSLNFKSYKNLVGTFYPPTEVYISAGFLSTLVDGDYLSGLGEIAKLCIIGGAESAGAFADALAGLLGREPAALTRFLRLALEIKKGYIEEDEFDAGRRNILNFGHCFGHAIESATGFAVSHGIAVVYGILLANIAARRRGLLSEDAERSMRDRILMPLISSAAAAAPFDGNLIIQGMKKDKKRTGAKLALVMALDGFKMARVDDLEETEAAAAIGEFNRSV